MIDNLKNIELRYQELEARLAANETYADPELVSRLNREQKELEPLVTAYRALCRAQSDLADAEELLGDPEMRELAQQELTRAKEEIERLEREIKILLLPKDPNDGKNVIMEIRAGERAGRAVQPSAHPDLDAFPGAAGAGQGLFLRPILTR